MTAATLVGVAFALAFVQLSSAQTLNLPPRPAGALTGTQFTNIVTSLTRDHRENWIFHQIVSGNVPDFLRTLKTINVSIAGHTATYYVTPDYLAVGSDADYFLSPMTPLLAQRLCDWLGYTLPTRKMVNQIWTNAAVKLTPQTIAPSPEMTTVPVFAWHNFMVRTQRNAFTNSFPLGALTAGDKKDVIISARIYTNFATAITEPVVIYGWHQTSGSPIQQLYNGHEETYADYSHGVRLVQMNLTVDGSSNTVTNVLKSPPLAPLLSDDSTSEGTSRGVIPLPRYTIGPTLIAQPRSQTVSAGESATFSTQVIGDAPLSYRWQFNSVNIPGATNSSFTITNVAGANAGNYAVIVTNAEGTVTSGIASLRLKSSAQPILFADNFDADSSTDWNLFWGSTNGVPDYTADWAFDYGSVSSMFNGVPALIPSAPNSANGTTRGLRFSVNNDASAVAAAVNVYPKSLSLTGNFVLKFDTWINYPGNAGGTGTGIAGSTQHGIFGINHLGTNVNWAAPSASASDGVWFAAAGEGGDSADYRAYIGNPGGTQINLTGSSSASGLAGSNHTAGVFQTLFPSTRFETTGAPGKTWIEVELRQVNGMVVWLMDGTIVALRTNASSFKSGTIMLGLMDSFPSIASPGPDAFMLIDNVRVERFDPTIRFQSVTRQVNGHVSLVLTNIPGDSYFLEVSTNLVSWQTLGTILTTNTTFSFIDSNAAAYSTRYYRARR